MTKFWGKLLLVNFAMGVVTGIVQEFQFGMSWSAYSRFVGDVFGAPLAMEGLVANHLAAHDNVVIGGVRPQPPEIVGIVLAVGIGEEGERRLDSFEAFSDGAGVSLPAPSRPEAHRVFFRQLSEDFVRAVCAPVLADEEVSSRRNDDLAVDDI